jgi:hypothetical protein
MRLGAEGKELMVPKDENDLGVLIAITFVLLSVK